MEKEHVNIPRKEINLERNTYFLKCIYFATRKIYKIPSAKNIRLRFTIYNNIVRYKMKEACCVCTFVNVVFHISLVTLNNLTSDTKLCLSNCCNVSKVVLYVLYPLTLHSDSSQ